MQEVILDEQVSNEEKSPIANIRDRMVAFLIDFVILWVLGSVFGSYFGKKMTSGIGFSLEGWPAGVFFLFILILWPISEGLYGQTIGKRILKIKVVKDDFKSKINMKQAFGRFFLGFVDYFFLMGLIIAAINNQNKRIGDMACHTTVIKINP